MNIESSRKFFSSLSDDMLEAIRIVKDAEYFVVFQHNKNMVAEGWAVASADDKGFWLAIVDSREAGEAMIAALMVLKKETPINIRKVVDCLCGNF